MIDQSNARFQADLALIVFVALVFVGVEQLLILF